MIVLLLLPFLDVNIDPFSVIWGALSTEISFTGMSLCARMEVRFGTFSERTKLSGLNFCTFFFWPFPGF